MVLLEIKKSVYSHRICIGINKEIPLQDYLVGVVGKTKKIDGFLLGGKEGMIPH
jgi:hypothetical protein